MSSNNSTNSRACSPAGFLEEPSSVSTISISNVPEMPMKEYGFGMEKAGAPALAAHTIVVTMDCEKFESEPRVLTEYGLNTFSRKDMALVLKTPGIYGEEMLRNIYYYHIRLCEHAHYINRRFCRGNPEKNRFGSTRFATKIQAKDFLTSCLSWPIEQNKKDGAKCPVIFLGHAVKNELQTLQHELGINPTVTDNVVAIIDTQKIAKEQGVHIRGEWISLADLMQNIDAEFRDGHTAGNDAAYTIIGALQMVMDGFQTCTHRTLQRVVDDVVSYSKEVVPEEVGVAKYCTRCASNSHNQPQCRGSIKKCDRCLTAGKIPASNTHITKLCSHGAPRW
ncbi:hypothetical protein G6011_03578 [Alternaria panax]|uniref:Gfd2/YDR514C-like C-terminal domain-containing protein n=1 Tax=Alternaria panax TaxID=48097 RepID=A0AAD4IFL2_9PLEO|nr:hypothetical protein G6011_03578 [Alternaria panax]